MSEPKSKNTGDHLESRMEVRGTAGLFRFSVAQLLVALVVLLLTYPFVVDLHHGVIIADVLMMIILISAALAAGGRHWALTVLLAGLALAGMAMDQYQTGLVPFWIISCARMVFVGFVITQLLEFVLRSTRVNSEVMCAGISAYLMLGILWTFAFQMASQLTPGSFTGLRLPANQHLDRFDALYFSFVTLTCLGCNEITPLSKVARMLLMVESTTGVLYLAVLIARLVALYTHSELASTPERPDS